MDNKKTEFYYIEKIVEDIHFILQHTNGIQQKDLEENEILLSAMCFKLVQISESAKMLPDSFKELYPNIPWNDINGLRNRIVHDYGNVNMKIIFNTIQNDLPLLVKDFEMLLENNQSAG